MDKNNQYNELLVRYLANETNAGENEFVENWIAASEDNRRHFEQLRDAWQLAGARQTLDYVLDQMNVEEKWSRFQQDIITKEGAGMVSPQEREPFNGEASEEPVRKPLVYRLMARVAVAAAVLLALGWGWKLLVRDRQETPVALEARKSTDSPMAVVRHEVNATGREKRLPLPDGSLIVLADSSEVTYREPFTGKREISLKGKAYFKVAKDPERPFTVISGEIATTALGTEFTVTAFENKKHIIVRLYEGKVVVKAVDRNSRKLKKNIYLLPGQAFVYGGRTAAKVKTTPMSNASPEQIMNEEASRDNPSLPQNEEGSWYMFNNQSLPHVLDQLAKMYRVEIIYDREAVKTIYFTRKCNSQDSIESILKEIALLNNLSVTRKDNAFVISKPVE